MGVFPYVGQLRSTIGAEVTESLAQKEEAEKLEAPSMLVKENTRELVAINLPKVRNEKDITKEGPGYYCRDVTLDSDGINVGSRTTLDWPGISRLPVGRRH